MKVLLPLVLLLFFGTISNAQNYSDQFLGSWDGFGYAENFAAKEGCLTRLTVEKIPNLRDSLKCTSVIIPVSENENFARGIESSVFNAAAKNGYLTYLNVDGTPNKISLVLDNNEIKIYHEIKYDGMTWEYLYSKSSNSNFDFSASEKITRCMETGWSSKSGELEKDKILNINSFPSNLRGDIQEEVRMQVNVGCMLKYINVSTAKYSYIRELKSMAINISGMTPFYFLIDEAKAKEIISSKRAVFNFRKLELFSQDNVNFIIPVEVEVTFPGNSVPVRFPQDEFAKIGSSKTYAGYVQKRNKIITK